MTAGGRKKENSLAWNNERSHERAQKRWDATASVAIGDVQRETDFENIGLSSPKRLTGVHVYVGSNLNGPLRSGTLEQPEAVRRPHIWKSEASRVISGLESTKVHFQDPRVHVPAYGLPDSAIKDGTGLKLRFSDRLTRGTPDLNTAFRADREQFVDKLKTTGPANWSAELVPSDASHMQQGRTPAVRHRGGADHHRPSEGSVSGLVQTLVIRP